MNKQAVGLIIGSVRANVAVWGDAMEYYTRTASTSVWRDVRSSLDAERVAAWSEVFYNSAHSDLPTCAWDAILCLIAYDDCAHMLVSDPGELEVLAALGDTRAILLLPACKVFHQIKITA